MTIGFDGRPLARDVQTFAARGLWSWFEEWPALGLPHQVVVFGDSDTDFNRSCWRDKMYTTLRLTEGWGPWWDRVALPRAVARESLDLFVSLTDSFPAGLSCPYLVGSGERGLETEGKAWFLEGYRARRRRSFRGSWRVLARSVLRKREEAERGDIPEERIAVVPFGSHEAFLPRSRRQSTLKAAARFGLSEPYLLCAAQDEASAIQAFGTLSPERRGGLRLVVCGNGIERHGTRRTLQSYEAAPRVLRLSPGPVDDLIDVYGAASAFLCFSVSERAAVHPLEALACGVPVVASQEADLPELLGEAPRYADPRDSAGWVEAIEGALGDGKARTVRRLAGFRHAAKNSGHHSLMRFLEVLEQFRWERMVERRPPRLTASAGSTCAPDYSEVR